VALLPHGVVPTEADNFGVRDPGVFRDDDGTHYIIFGTFEYYVSQLNSDLISLAEAPRGPVLVHNPMGPYGAKLDDKPFLHKRNGVYYLSWGCFYGVGNSPYGPFNYTGVVYDDAFAEASFQRTAEGDGQADRHGSFFTLHGQDYFAMNDRTHGARQDFRSTVRVRAGSWLVARCSRSCPRSRLPGLHCALACT
jgi:hypothetical protein